MGKFIPVRSLSSAPSTAASLLSRWSAGDEQAGCALVELLYPLVTKIVLAHLPRRESPEDLSQEIFAKVFSRSHQFDARSPLEHWVARIAVCTCRDRLRHHSRRPSKLVSELSEGEQSSLARLASDPTAALLTPAEARTLLEQLLCQLTPAERALITWLDLEDRSISEVAVLTASSSPVVRLRAFRARKQLCRLAARLNKEHYLP